ncbi:MAG: [protein-PII] uridylyltransferase [Porticoccaceae bacterium]|nr:[protein-PII] uridylyltransferase [Porticoccaceae bacterium]
MTAEHLRQPLLFFDEQRFIRRLAEGGALTVFKDAIAAASGHLNNRFLEGEQVSTLVFERATFMDCILLHAWHRFRWGDDIALLAVGGYGRGELHPHSDIDILILLGHDEPHPYQSNIERFLTFLWDIQLVVGQSVRSIRQCVEEAEADITVATNLMECRTLVGNPALRLDMLQRTGPDNIWPSDAFFRAKRAEQIGRHRKYGYTEYNLEPNVKEGPGGLRDIQTIKWVACRHFQVNALSELMGQGFINEEELDLLRSGEEFLWKVRYGLHLLAGRSEERLLFDNQRKLASQFGYRDSEQRLGVEQFMHRYYRVVLSMRELNDVLLQYLDENILRKDQARQVRPINEHFQVRDDYIETVDDKVFERDPSALLELFVLLAEDPSILGIRAATIRQLQLHRYLIDDAFRADPRNQELFMRLFSCSGKLTLQLQRMTRYGILGRYLPEFGRITGQPQHDLFHLYPVDVHTLQVIRNMRRLDRPEETQQLPVAGHIYKNLQKPELLFIAGLFHDIGKGRGGDHSMLGAVDVVAFAERHGLPSQEVRLLKWLVEKHLLMSSVSQREDISDPDVIQHFATLVGDQIRLDYLFLLTICDIRGTNPTLWNSWRASLLETLYQRTRRALQRGLENPASRSEWVAGTRSEALAILATEGIDAATTQAIWGDVDEDFFLRERAAVIASWVRAIHDSRNPEEPVILVEEAGLEQAIATRIFIHTTGLQHVFPITAATLDQLSLNIQDARLHTASNGHTFDVFYVLGDDGRPLGDDSDRVAEVFYVLSKALRAPTSDTVVVRRRTPLRLKHFNLKTRTFLHNDTSGNFTALEVITPDRPGLLAHLGRIFMRFGLRLHSARIATLGERVEDVFYLTDQHYQPLSDPDFCQQLQTAICSELDARNAQDAAGATPRHQPT